MHTIYNIFADHIYIYWCSELQLFRTNEEQSIGEWESSVAPGVISPAYFDMGCLAANILNDEYT